MSAPVSAKQIALWMAVVMVGVVVVGRLVGAFNDRREDVARERLRAAEVRADSIKAARAQWRQDSIEQAEQDAADSVRAQQLRIYTDRANRQLAVARARLDSLTRQGDSLRASLAATMVDTLVATATASDSAAHWQGMAAGQGRLLSQQGDELLACRAVDRACQVQSAMLTTEREQALGAWRRVRGERDRYQRERDVTAVALDSLRTAQVAVKRAGRCTFGLPCPELAVFAGVTTAGDVRVGVGLAVPLKRLRL